jgi:UDP-N-acetylmuramoyl-L-alanyl-D-glutamate--2,6-diaminopimelate ligase
MGSAAASAADVVFITSDNPRSERPDAIIQEIVAGIPLSVQGTRYAISDRREAIFCAIKEAQAGDCVAILGKGHENYQILSDRTISFDDVSVAKEALECLKS